MKLLKTSLYGLKLAGITLIGGAGVLFILLLTMYAGIFIVNF